MVGVAEKVVRLSGDIPIAAGNKLPGLLLRAKMPRDTGFKITQKVYKGILFHLNWGK